MKSERRFAIPCFVLVTVGLCTLLSLPAVATVVPCPNQQVDSSASIQAALETAGKGETVYLQAGTYYVANPIWVRTAFQGALRGAGKNQTIITTLPGFKIHGIPNPWFGSDLSTIFQFEVPVGQIGDIRVSDFSIVITDPEPAVQDDEFFQGALYNIFVVFGTRVNTRFERLRLVASEGAFFERNVAHAFHIGGLTTDLMKGNHVLAETEFERMAVSYNTFSIRDGLIKVMSNTFTNNFYGPALEDCSNCTGEVTSNKIISPDFEGIFISQGYNTGFIPPKPSSYVVASNTILASGATLFESGFADGILLADIATDSGASPKLYAGVAFNDIKLVDTQGAGIVGIGAQRAIVLSNTMAGTGLSGIATGIFGDTVKGWLILSNNVEGVNALVAPVWLGSGTNHCTVVGDGHQTLVLDEGSDNKLINVTKVQASTTSSRSTQRMRLRSLSRLPRLR